jgi:hypothetical protein
MVNGDAGKWALFTKFTSGAGSHAYRILVEVFICLVSIMPVRLDFLHGMGHRQSDLIREMNKRHLREGCPLRVTQVSEKCIHPQPRTFGLPLSAAGGVTFRLWYK